MKRGLHGSAACCSRKAHRLRLGGRVGRGSRRARGMPRTAQFAIRRGHARGLSFSRASRIWRERLAGVERRLYPAAGVALAVASLLLLLALLTYSRTDGSLDTAATASPANYLGRDGAVVADVLIQGFGLAAYLLPAALLGWAFRLLLQHPIRRPLGRLAVLLPALVVGAFACSILQPAAALPAGAGGALGSLALDLIERLGLGGIALPLAMAAAALVALLLLAVINLSPGDWRDLGHGAGRGASRVARLSGHGTAAAAGFAGRLFRRWRAGRAPDRTAPPWPIRPPAPGERHEQQFAAAGAAPQPRPAPVEPPVAGRFVRLVLPRAKQSAARRADPDR